MSSLQTPDLNPASTVAETLLSEKEKNISEEKSSRN